MVFDATHLSRLAAGVSTYIVNLVAALAALEDRAWDLSVLARPEHADLLGSRSPGIDLQPIRLRSTAVRVVWEQTRLPSVLAGLDAALLHSPHYSIPLALRLPRAVTVHDLTYVTMPERHRASRRWYFRWMIPRAVRRAAHVFCVSQTTLDDLRRLYPDVDPGKLSVARLAPAPGSEPGARQLSAVGARYGLSAGFVLHVGTVEPRKNIGTAIAAVAALRAWRPEVELVLVGQGGWESSALFRSITESPFVRHIGHVPDEDLAALYRMAGLLVAPSHYEGFGLPVLEAMQAGTPVVTSGKGSLREVAGAAGVIPLRDDPEAYAEAMLRLLTDERWRAEVTALGRAQAARFTWEDTAEITRAAYDRLLGLAPRPAEAAAHLQERR